MKYILPFLALALGLYYWLMPKNVIVENQCNLAMESCLINHTGLKAEVSIKPMPPSLNKEFIFQVKYQDNRIENVEAMLIGLSFNHVPVKLPLKRKSPIFYEAESLFPICTERMMKWRIHLVTLTDGVKYKTNFDFEAKRD